MTTSHFHTNRSAASDLHVYGLAGIELSRATERREGDLINTLTHGPNPLSAIRQRVGDTLIRLGTDLAGEAARTPRAPQSAQPRIDMA